MTNTTHDPINIDRAFRETVQRLSSTSDSSQFGSAVRGALTAVEVLHEQLGNGHLQPGPAAPSDAGTNGGSLVDVSVNPATPKSSRKKTGKASSKKKTSKKKASGKSGQPTKKASSSKKKKAKKSNSASGKNGSTPSKKKASSKKKTKKKASRRGKKKTPATKKAASKKKTKKKKAAATQRKKKKASGGRKKGYTPEQIAELKEVLLGKIERLAKEAVDTNISQIVNSMHGWKGLPDWLQKRNLTVNGLDWLVRRTLTELVEEDRLSRREKHGVQGAGGRQVIYAIA